MSTAKRLISGSIASWIRIGVTMVSQIVLVPVYLTYWKIEVYATWLAIQALIAVLSTLDIGHQNFLGYEFFKFTNGDKPGLSRLLCSGVLVGVSLGLLQILIIVGLLISPFLPPLLGIKDTLHAVLIHEAGIVLLMQGIAWLIAGSFGGLAVRVLSPFGYFPRFNWWGVFAAVLTTVSPAVAVLMGCDLLQTGFVLAIATIAFNIPQFVDMFRLFKKEHIVYTKPSLGMGLSNFFKSLALSARGLLENARQQGARLVLNPLAGSVGLVAFSTMRTGANVALQGLGTITNPLLPELMRFLYQRNQEKSESAFATVWIIVIAILTPSVVILQVVIEPVFLLWTRGKVHFDPFLFAVFSQSVLVFAVAQPAMAIMEGNNLLRPQLTLSAMSAIIVVGGMFVLVPLIGIRGAGLALLVAEICATIGYRNVARRWMAANGLVWPRVASATVVVSIWISALAMGLMIISPHFKLVILPLSLIALFWNCRRYWKMLPAVAVTQVENTLFKIIRRKKQPAL